MAGKKDDEAMKARISTLLMESGNMLFAAIPNGPASIILALEEVSRLFGKETKEMRQEFLRESAQAESERPPPRIPLQPKLPRRFGTSHHRAAKPDDPTKR